MNDYIKKNNNNNNNKTLTFEMECFEWISTIINALVIFIVIFTVFVKLIVVNGVSMMPTLHDRDWMILNSFLYNPKKDDIVVIKKNKSLYEPIIKRIIAEENDFINICDGKVYVNGELKNEKEFIGDSITMDYGDMTFPQVVPEGCYFVLGDNRENSLDSRFKKVGFINKNEILGEAKLIIFPFDRFRIT